MGDHNVNPNGPTSRRGGRKRPSNEDDLTEEERSKKLKNREAAKRCRLRKIEESKNLKQQNEELESQNKMLTKKKMDLEAKIIQCMDVIKEHEKHGCKLPDDVLGILNTDGERSTCTDGFHPVGIQTIHRNQNISPRLTQSETLSIQITESNGNFTLSDSRNPTGLFSGTEIEMDQSKMRIPKSLSPVTLTTRAKDMDTVSDSQGKIQHLHEMPLKYSSSLNGYFRGEEGEGHYQSSSPVQRVPNIDQVPWSSPSAKPNGADESGDDEYSYGSRSDAAIEIPQAVNIQSSSDKLCGGILLSNSSNHMTQDLVSTSHKTDNEIKPFQVIDNPNTATKPLLMPYQTRPLNQNKSSVTQSLQVTTELISQAIHDIDPSEISQSLHAQIVECTKPDSSIPFTAMDGKDYLIPDSSSISENQEEIPQESHQQLGYEIKPQQLEVIHHQTNKSNTEVINSVPVSSAVGAYAFYENNNVDNLQSSSLSSTLNEFTIIPQNYIIADKSLENPGQPQVVTAPYSILINVGGQFQQFGQAVEEIVEPSQIPTTVFNDDEENETPGSEEHASEKAVPSHVVENALESTENVNVTSSTDNYSANVSELPSLSFNDLHNTPKEIFDKKPSRLRTK